MYSGGEKKTTTRSTVPNKSGVSILQDSASTNGCPLAQAPRQNQAIRRCENVILVSMQDYMDRTTLIAWETGTVFVEIVIGDQSPLDHLPIKGERAMQRLLSDTRQSRGPE